MNLPLKHTRMTSLTSKMLLRACYLFRLHRPMLLSVRGFAITSDGYFYRSFSKIHDKTCLIQARIKPTTKGYYTRFSIFPALICQCTILILTNTPALINTVDPHYLEFGYLELALISKIKSDPCLTQKSTR